MSKKTKEEVEGFILLLSEVQEEVFKAIEMKKYDVAMKSLETCQERAFQFGTLLERIQGEGFITVGILEEYCEKIYQFHEELVQNRDVNIDQIYISLNDFLIRVKNSVKNNFKVRMEVVFLPYKASMWDSLESVWKAAEEDSDCEAFVIPIPYYDKNLDGSFGEMHYEGNQYPDYVPITDYNSYDFESRHPDMIFIHNPYDKNNFVTSIHPFFYSDNLKRFTDKLVYIPYFVLKEINLNEQNALQNMEQFVIAPAVIHADQIIVQSENMRQAYIHIMTKLAGEKTRKIWENKILGLGSPKYDKVLSSRREDVQIPEEWENLIKKKKGSYKKVILYNTSVTALLKHSDKMLQKMQEVFCIFKHNQDSVTLLWRPHPLVKATISSMRPELWQAYLKLVEQYRQDGWGIYDDSANLDRAITICDAYYGDPSSVVQLCSEAKIPIMIQDVK